MSKTEKYEGMRIYVVVPGTVQTPIKIMTDTRSPGLSSAGRFEDTRDIVQPAGRQAMQVGHVRAVVEHHLIFLELNKVLYGKKKIPRHLSTLIPPRAITGIVKAARDSFELIHIKNLLEERNVRYFEFRDTQEDLYEDVVTALATEPVTPFAVAGILDYLPLWTGK